MVAAVSFYIVTLTIISLAIPVTLYLSDQTPNTYVGILVSFQVIVNICDFLTMMVLIYLSHSFGPYLQ